MRSSIAAVAAAKTAYKYRQNHQRALRPEWEQVLKWISTLSRLTAALGA